MEINKRATLSGNYSGGDGVDFVDNTKWIHEYTHDT
jgi:hypothetical protein